MADETDPSGESLASGDALERAEAIGAERILNQEEIDSLLGFDLSDDDGDERSGIRAIVNSALVSYERLPMLEVVFDRLVRMNAGHDLRHRRQIGRLLAVVR